MPPLLPPQQNNVVKIPEREAKVVGNVDVLVVGGGPAGLGAAMGAADAGACVILAERYGFLGGNATAALVTPWMSYHTHSPRLQSQPTIELMPEDHGPGRPVIAGVLKKLVERVVKEGGAVDPTSATGYVVPFDPEILKITALDLLDESNVDYLFHCFASGIIQNKTDIGVILETKSGPLVIKAKVVVDCTGDGDIAAFAGAGFEIGREEDGLVQPMTLMFRMIEFQREAFNNYVRKHPDQWHGVYGLWDLIKNAVKNQELKLAREDILFFGTAHPREVTVNCTRIVKVLGINVWDLTYAEWEGRRQMRQIEAFFRKYVPGFEKAYVVQSGAIGVRETRRITGEYQLTANDLLQARKFHDVIARGTYPLDIHNPIGKGTFLRRIPSDEFYDIPLRSLIPKDTDKLVVAGRCISGTHEAHSSYRIMPISMATGQAAGICAALASLRGIEPRDVPYQEVRKELLRQGCDLK
jgi:hypothetical protein